MVLRRVRSVAGDAVYGYAGRRYRPCGQSRTRYEVQRARLGHHTAHNEPSTNVPGNDGRSAQAQQTTHETEAAVSGRKLLAATAAASRDNSPACLSRHALAEAMTLGAAAHIWLESSLHDSSRSFTYRWASQRETHRPGPEGVAANEDPSDRFRSLR